MRRKFSLCPNGSIVYYATAPPETHSGANYPAESDANNEGASLDDANLWELETPEEPKVKRFRRTFVKNRHQFLNLRFNPSNPFKTTACFTCLNAEESDDNPIMTCASRCGAILHKSCMVISRHQGSSSEVFYVCSDCSDGIVRCFLCKKPGNVGVVGGKKEDELIRCVAKRCYRRYHSTCLLKEKYERFYRLENGRVLCPQHTCHMCILDNVGTVKLTQRYARCILCPVAYHVGEWCIPAGSVELSSLYIVCPIHLMNSSSYAHEKLMKMYRKQSLPLTSETPSGSGGVDNDSDALSVYRAKNVTWCFLCSKNEGTLICCDHCPASFHPACLNIDKIPSESYTCESCVQGLFPRYGSLVWAKMKKYPWWPSEVVRFNFLPPESLDNSSRFPGQFAVRLLGLDKYVWISRAVCFPFEENDGRDVLQHRQGKDFDTDPNLEQVFQDSLKTADEMYNLWKEQKHALFLTGRFPDNYKHIKTNFPIGNVRINKVETLSEIPACDCDPNGENPCGPSSKCINVESKFECHPAVCPNRERCRNQRFTRLEYPSLEPFSTKNRGWGLRILEDIKKDQFVVEYVGDLIDTEEAERRLKAANISNIKDYYMMVLDSQRVIDAGPRGNHARFTNHSCSPNLYSEKWTVNGDTRVGLFALRDIKSGEELTFNYNFIAKGLERMECHCGAPNCSGFLGTSVATSDSAANPIPELSLRPSEEVFTMPRRRGRPKGSFSSRKSLQMHKNSLLQCPTSTTSATGLDVECFCCGSGEGELIACNKANCDKLYHLRCLDLERIPSSEKWLCPWHHCNICGLSSDMYCNECSTSYCLSHWPKKVCAVQNGQIVCIAHEEVLNTLGIKTHLLSSKEDFEAILNGDCKFWAECTSQRIPVPIDGSSDV